MSTLSAHALGHAYAGGSPVLEGVSLTLAPGALVCLVGPNGSGKSTLLRLLAGLLAPRSGSAALDGRPVAALAPAVRARALAFVPQGLEPLADLDARSFVLGGRYAHQSRWAGLLARTSRADRDAVERALSEADALELAERRLDTLSRGQFQRVLVARALAQEAPFLLLDEPTAALDPEHQVRLFLLLERLVASGRAALVATHELYLASRFAQRCIVLSQGRAVAQGEPAAIFRPEVLSPVFGPHLAFTRLAPSGPTLVVPWPAH